MCVVMIKVKNVKLISLPLICGGFMGINHINNRAKINPNELKYIPENKKGENFVSQDGKLLEELDKMSMINNVNISKKDFELNLSMEELQKRTHLGTVGFFQLNFTMR